MGSIDISSYAWWSSALVYVIMLFSFILSSFLRSSGGIDCYTIGLAPSVTSQADYFSLPA